MHRNMAFVPSVIIWMPSGHPSNHTWDKCHVPDVTVPLLTFIMVTRSLPFILAGVTTGCGFPLLMIFMRDRKGTLCTQHIHCRNTAA